MSVAKNIEVISSSTKGFDDAVTQGIQRAAKTIENLRGAWIKDQKVSIENGAVAEYRVTMILTFVVSDSE